MIKSLHKSFPGPSPALSNLAKPTSSLLHSFHNFVHFRPFCSLGGTQPGLCEHFLIFETHLAGLLKIKKVTAFGNLKTRLSQFLWILSIFSVLVSIRFIFQHLNRYGNWIINFHICSICLKQGKLQIKLNQGRYDVVCPATSAWELHQVQINFKGMSFQSNYEFKI